MIYKSLELIRQNLEDYIALRLGDSDALSVDLANIASFDLMKPEGEDAMSDSKSKLVMSLVNIQEETSLKNKELFRIKKMNGEVDYQAPPVFINLYVLFSACHDSYSEALQKLSMVMEFFQSKNIFTLQYNA